MLTSLFRLGFIIYTSMAAVHHRKMFVCTGKQSTLCSGITVQTYYSLIFLVIHWGFWGEGVLLRALCAGIEFSCVLYTVCMLKGWETTNTTDENNKVKYLARPCHKDALLNVTLDFPPLMTTDCKNNFPKCSVLIPTSVYLGVHTVPLCA